MAISQYNIIGRKRTENNREAACCAYWQSDVSSILNVRKLSSTRCSNHCSARRLASGSRTAGTSSSNSVTHVICAQQMGHCWCSEARSFSTQQKQNRCWHCSSVGRRGASRQSAQTSSQPEKVVGGRVVEGESGMTCSCERSQILLPRASRDAVGTAALSFA